MGKRPAIAARGLAMTMALTLIATFLLSVFGAQFMTFTALDTPTFLHSILEAARPGIPGLMLMLSTMLFALPAVRDYSGKMLWRWAACYPAFFAFSQCESAWPVYVFLVLFVIGNAKPGTMVRTFVRLTVIFAVSALYQPMVLLAKFGKLVMPWEEIAVADHFALWIDATALNIAIVIYDWKGGGKLETYNREMVAALVRSVRGHREKGDRRNPQTDGQSITAWVAWALQLVQIAIMMLVCAVSGRLAICAYMVLLGHAVNRKYYPCTLHTKTYWRCTVVSVGVVFSCARISPSLHVSMYGAPIIGACVAYANAWISNIIDSMPRAFRCATATMEEFLARCLESGFNAEQTAFAVDALSCNRITEKELADKHGKEPDAAHKMKVRYKKKLESKAP